MAALQYLEYLRNKHPGLADWCNTLGVLYQKKLWHQLALELDLFITLPIFHDGDALIRLYDNFISDFNAVIGHLRLAHIVGLVSRQYKDKDAAIEFLDGMYNEIDAAQECGVTEPLLCIEMQKALLKLEQGDQNACKEILKRAEDVLDMATDLDPSVFATFHFISSLYHKYRLELSEFYTNALLFLAHTTIMEPFLDSFKQGFVFDLCLAALLGDHIYNFRELLAHPIIKSLMGTPIEWVYCILEAFNLGDLSRYEELRRVHNASFRAQLPLVKNEQMLLEKIKILCLMEIIFSWPSEDRTIPMIVIADRTKLSVEDVEYLLMKSFSVHVIEGIIDQVDRTVRVSWVLPRVLGIPQIKFLRDRLDKLIGKVHTALLSVEPDLGPAL